MQKKEKNSSSAHLYGMIVFVFAFLLYANTIPNDYNVDDIHVTPQNTLVSKGIRSIPKILTSPYYSVEKKKSEYRPLAKISFAIEYEFFGMNPHLSHFIQALLYALTCLVLFGFLQFILSSFSLLLPFSVTLLFIAHPLHTEVVASLKNREELLAFAFSVLSAWLLIKGWKEKQKSFLVFSILLFLLSIVSKQSGIVLFIWAPLFLYFTVTGMEIKKLIFVSAFYLFIGILFILAVNFLFVNNSITEANRAFSFYENPLANNSVGFPQIGLAFNSLGFYFSKILFPHPLSWYYGFNTMPLQMPWEIKPLLYFLIHFILFAWALYNIRKQNLLSFSILLYLFAILPYINFPFLYAGIVSERASFFASLGFSLASAVLIMDLLKIDYKLPTKKNKIIFWILILPVLLIYSIKTYSRNKEWKDTLTLYHSDIKHLNNSFKAHENYASELLRLYRTQEHSQDTAMLREAFLQFQLALKIFPASANTNAKIGEILSTEYGRYEEAMTYLKKAVTLQSNDEWYHFDLAYCYNLQKQYDSAIFHYKTSIRLDSSFVASSINLSVLFSEIGMQDSAINYNRIPLKYDFNSEIGNANMGFFYMKKGSNDTATYYFKKALSINPNREDVIAALTKTEQ